MDRRRIGDGPFLCPSAHEEGRGPAPALPQGQVPEVPAQRKSRMPDPDQLIVILIVFYFEDRREKIPRRWPSPHRLAGYLTLATACVGLLIKLVELQSCF